MKMQALNRNFYDNLIPNFFGTCKTRGKNLQTMLIHQPAAVLLFQDDEGFHINSHKTKLKWKKRNQSLYTIENGKKKDFLWKEDWGKIVYLYDSSYFIAGGSW